METSPPIPNAPGTLRKKYRTIIVLSNFGPANDRSKDDGAGFQPCWFFCHPFLGRCHRLG
jgi:hypothetical protein